MIARIKTRKTRKKGTGCFCAGENDYKTRAKTAPRHFPVLDAIKAACPLFSEFYRLCLLFCLVSVAIVCSPGASADAIDVQGTGFAIAKLDNGVEAYSNRKYTWMDVPAKFKGWSFTRLGGGVRSNLTATSRTGGFVYIATAVGQKGIDTAGWTMTRWTFRYSDRARTPVTVFNRTLKASEKLTIPQGNWTGGIVLAPVLTGESAGPAKPDHSKTPGVVIDYIPASRRTYVGSPSIAILPGGAYAASHDIFGPRSTQSVTLVFRSDDKGATWRRQAKLGGQWWSGLFVHKGDLYIMGVSKSYGNVVIRRSKDGGKTWTSPKGGAAGLLLTGGRYHTSSVPAVVHNGHLWRAMEDNTGLWGAGFRSFMMSAPLDAALLDSANWTISNRLAGNPGWMGGKFGGWLEGNAVATRDGGIVNILRVHSPGGGKAAVVSISDDGKTASFDPDTGFIDFPGGCKKFNIRFDPKTKLYWSLTNAVLDRYRGRNRADRTRNVLALTSSPDLKRWTIRSIVLEHPDTHKVGFQYVDWLFEGADLVAAVRMAFPDGVGGAHNCHDANYLAFYRVKNFRKLTMTDKAKR